MPESYPHRSTRPYTPHQTPDIEPPNPAAPLTAVLSNRSAAFSRASAIAHTYPKTYRVANSTSQPHSTTAQVRFSGNRGLRN
ncbi:hypothetical protein ACQ4M4_24350 [Leptolyngbya sp. AN02str]|uniref:hypothetical protein n=1 Tax=Leptolyngbya sp. AN02str TaxID=3423363 RepID=UPI003D31CD61